jgi:hypothetical protein
MRKVTARVTVTVILKCDEDVDVDKAIGQMLYAFESDDSRVDVDDTQWGEIEIIDSR